MGKKKDYVDEIWERLKFQRNLSRKWVRIKARFERSDQPKEGVTKIENCPIFGAEGTENFEKWPSFEQK